MVSHPKWLYSCGFESHPNILLKIKSIKQTKTMETKQNTGAIFKNNNKTKDTQPDYRGKVNVEGKEFEISLWLKESKQGVKYFSASFQEPYVKPATQMSETMSNNIAASIEQPINDLPF